MDEKELLANADPKKSFLVFDLAVGGVQLSRDLTFFDTMHDVDIPTSVHIDTSLEDFNGVYTVTLRSPVLARSVYLSFGDLDVQTLDNYFDLLPGEPVTVKLKTSSSVSLDQLKSSMQVISLTDAFRRRPQCTKLIESWERARIVISCSLKPPRLLAT